ncbi:hypothetical protein [Consotaella aegiceratis]
MTAIGMVGVSDRLTGHHSMSVSSPPIGPKLNGQRLDNATFDPLIAGH